MQTAAHVSGAAHFYSREQLKNDPFPPERVNVFFLIISFLHQTLCFGRI